MFINVPTTPQYPTLESYPNNRRLHQLRIFKNGFGVCSCEAWELSGASESSCIASHQLHVTNHEASPSLPRRRQTKTEATA